MENRIRNIYISLSAEEMEEGLYSDNIKNLIFNQCFLIL